MGELFAKKKALPGSFAAPVPRHPHFTWVRAGVGGMGRRSSPLKEGGGGGEGLS